MLPLKSASVACLLLFVSACLASCGGATNARSSGTSVSTAAQASTAAKTAATGVKGDGAAKTAPTESEKKVKLPELPPVLMGKLMGRERLAVGGLPTDKELQGAWARVFLRSNPGPYQYVAYEITSRGKAGVVSHLRGTMGRKDPIIRTELIDRDKLRLIMGKLRDLGAASLADPGPLVDPEESAKRTAASPKGKKRRKPGKKGKNGKNGKKRKKAGATKAIGKQVDPDEDDEKRWPDASDVPIYELSYRLGGKHRNVVVADPYGSGDKRYALYINAVRASVIRTVGDIGWHAGTGSDASGGFLFIDSVPSSAVTVDGVKVPGVTPVFAYPTSPGKHTIVLENEAHGLKRVYKVQVRRGQTTSLEVDLR